MTSPTCLACHQPLADGYATVTLTFEGFTGAAALNGVAFKVHSRCLSLTFPPSSVELPPRREEGAAELVTVEQYGSDWYAACAQHGTVSVKDNVEDAHLGAAYHLARVHSGLA